ncbi:pre-mRNA-splicing factor CWC22 homolog [Electrophorus electricus]|uniref:pre-mRNA-splicing factor CWC22 homolog n=1 Tax=Electrophorus electricus TaxID=8005 RepID=UPI0015CFCAF1|nr:pre-mRNA-splicing factor CWC22 homolog [Electrophorus electricus]
MAAQSSKSESAVLTSPSKDEDSRPGGMRRPETSRVSGSSEEVEQGEQEQSGTAEGECSGGGGAADGAGSGGGSPAQPGPRHGSGSSAPRDLSDSDSSSEEDSDDGAACRMKSRVAHIRRGSQDDGGRARRRSPSTDREESGGRSHSRSRSRSRSPRNRSDWQRRSRERDMERAERRSSRDRDRNRGERRSSRGRDWDRRRGRSASPLRPERPLTDEPPVKKKKEELDPILTRTGGAYIPPARLRMMQAQISDKSSLAFQRMSWEALKKSINGLVNKVNVSNIGNIIQELLQENIVRGRGLLARSLLQAQSASPIFTHVYAALVAIINSKFPQIGELILKRLILNFRKGYRRNDKQQCLTASKFVAHLINQNVAHEVLCLEMLTLLLERPTDDSVEVAISFLKECGLKLTEVSPRGINAIFERLRNILHESEIDKRVQYMIEVMFAIRKDGFKDHPVVPEGLDLVEDEDQFTHMLPLEDEYNLEDVLNVFKMDTDFLENEEKYKSIRKEILDEGSSDSGDDAEGSDEEEEDEDNEEDGEAGEDEAKVTIFDQTEVNLVSFRRTIYLAIQSSLDFEECAHKLIKMDFPESQTKELCNMILDCCAQQRTYEKFFGLLAGRFCLLKKDYMESFEAIFQEQYDTIHRLETNKLRNVARLFAHLLYTDSVPWSVLECIKMSEETTTSSSRIFVKILFQELCAYMGLPRLNERLKDTTLQPFFEGLFPRDNPRNTRFAINFFTSIGLGGLTDELREHLKNAPKMIMTQNQDVESSDSSSSSSSSSDTSSDSDSSHGDSDSSSDSDDSSNSSSSDTGRRRKKASRRGRAEQEKQSRHRSPSEEEERSNQRRENRRGDGSSEGYRAPDDWQRETQRHGHEDRSPPARERARKNSPDGRARARKNSPDDRERARKSSPDERARARKGSPDEQARARKGSPDDRGRARKGSPDDSMRARKGSPDGRERARKSSPDDRARARKGSPDDRARARKGSPEDRARARKGSPEDRARARKGSPEDRARARKGSPEDRARARKGSPEDRARARKGSPEDRARARKGSPDDRARARKGSPDDSMRARKGSPDDSMRARKGSPDGRERTRKGSPDGRERARKGSPDGRERARKGSPDARERARKSSPDGRERARKSSPDGPNGRERARKSSPDGRERAQKDTLDDRERARKDSTDERERRGHKDQQHHRREDEDSRRHKDSSKHNSQADRDERHGRENAPSRRSRERSKSRERSCKETGSRDSYRNGVGREDKENRYRGSRSGESSPRRR